MKKLIEKRNDLITRAEEIITLAKTENRELSAEEMTEFNNIKSEVENIDKTLDAEKQFRAMEMREKPEGKKEDKGLETRDVKVGDEIIKVRVDEWNDFEKYLRNDRDADVNMTKTDNGAIIPTTIVNYIIRKVYNICPILERSQKFNVKGKLDIPYYPYDSNNITVAYKDEFSALTSTSGKINTIELTGYLAGCLTKVSRSLINNTNFNIVGFVVDEMAYAIARFIEHELLIGTTSPSAKVLGLSTLSNSVTAASANAITADEVIKLHDKIKDQFQRNAIWIMSPATRTALRLLKDEMGRYMLQDDISLPFGSSLLGKPVYVSDNMPEIATGNTAIYYGDMHGLATKFNEDINIEVLRERYADEHCYGVIGWLEFDGKVIDEQQIAKLVMA